MSKVITYKNDKFRCFCQIKFDNGERILISIASSQNPSVKISKLGLGGLIPIRTIWEFTPTMAGGYDTYVRKLIAMFIDLEKNTNKHPLDAIRDKLLPSHSIDEAIRILLSAEREASIKYNKDVKEKCDKSRAVNNIKLKIMTEEEMWDVISTYGAVLEEKGRKGQVYASELLLPHTKEKITEALRQALLTGEDKKTIDNLEVAYISLADFLPEPDGSLAISLNKQFQELKQEVSTATKEELKSLLSTSVSVFEHMERILKIVSDESHRLMDEVKQIREKRMK